MLFRSASHQIKSAAVCQWYGVAGCMSTKSSVTGSYSRAYPDRKSMSSFRLRDKVKRLLPPCFALGFDQLELRICTPKFESHKGVTMGELRSLSRLGKFGRPFWNALFTQVEENAINVTLMKLTNGVDFNPSNQDHVLAVLSERLCINLVLGASEVFHLADQSVPNRMTLLTGISSKPITFYRYSPSEPILALAATRALFKPTYTWPTSLHTFTAKLCDSGVVRKGLLGELAARTLLLITRDFAAPTMEVDEGPNMLEPVSLLTFLDMLFGGEQWSSPHQKSFKNSFRDTYLNFTHWVITKASLPEEADPQFLADLWARQAALQCAYNQAAIDLLIPTYAGSITHDDVFNPAMLSAVVVQVKYKRQSDTAAEDDLRPLGINRDLNAPLPYVTFLMELGSESHHRRLGKKVKATVREPDLTPYSQLVKNWTAAVDMLEVHKALESPKAQIEVARKAVEVWQKAMQNYNRYSIAARGSSADTYGILKEAKVEEAFAALLKVTAPSTELHGKIPHMHLHEGSGKSSGHTDWTFEDSKGD